MARGQHYLILGSTELTNDGKLKLNHLNSYRNWKFAGLSVAAQERILAQEKLLQPWIGLGNTADISETDLQQLIAKTVSSYLLQKT